MLPKNFNEPMGAPAIFEKQRGIKLLPPASTLKSRIQVLRMAPPLCVASVFFLMRAAHLLFPLASTLRFPRSVQEPVSDSCRLYTGCHLGSKQVTSRLLPR
ncbi:MAG: hypothetical protein P8X89_08910 [Reinekea sp.]